MQHAPLEQEPLEPRLDAVQRSQLIAIVGMGIDRDVAIDYVGADYADVLLQTRCDASLGAELTRAERQFELTQLQILNRQADKNWRVAAWLLERRLPERYGRTTRGIPARIVRRMCDQFVAFVLKSIPEASHRNRLEVVLRCHIEFDLPQVQEEAEDAAKPS